MAKDEKDLEGEVATGGGKKKLLIIIAGAVALLLIGGVLAWLLMGGDEAPAEETTAQAQEEAAPPPKPDPLYYEFKPQFVVNLSPGGRARLLQVKLQVMSREPAVIEYIDHNAPMLRHHLFNLFAAQDAGALFGRGGREALAKATQKKLAALMMESGHDGDIEAVFFTELVLQ